ncbi:MAG TPA: nuclear transport factor 2 family protein [Sphingomonas sp.]|nr:nuclear transport factor 2 family protein [Sphingomonas sp.]
MTWANVVIIAAIGSLFAPPCMAATPEATAVQTERAVLDAEAGFWKAFNSCDAAAMADYFTANAEFYHDITGLTATRERVVASMMTGPCSNPADQRLRRELVAGSERFTLLAGGYAMLSGQQRFFAGDDRARNSIAGCVEIWQRTDAGWQMKRVVSYAHETETLPN